MSQDNISHATDKLGPRLCGVLFAGGFNGTRIARRFDVEWSEFTFADVFPDIPAPNNKSRIQLWSAGHYREGATRGVAGLLRLHAAVLDGDCAREGTFDEVIAHLGAQGLAYFAHTSFSHLDTRKVRKSDKAVGPFDCFRVVLPYSRPVTPAEHSEVVRRLYGHEVPAGSFWDAKAESAAQSWGVPVVRGDGVERRHVRVGAALDVDAVLVRSGSTSRAVTRRAGAPRTISTTKPRATATAAGRAASARVDEALQVRGVHAVSDGRDRLRAPCPACAPSGQQKSPSFTCAVDGDHVRVNCHADGCGGRQALAALGLEELWGTETADAFRGRALLAQLFYTANVPERLYTLDEAQVEIRSLLRQGMTGIINGERKNLLLRASTGAGKTELTCEAVAERLALGLDERIVYLASEHALLSEVREKLAQRGIAATQLASALRDDVATDAPKCELPPGSAQRKRVLRMVEQGYSLGSVCGDCDREATCAARCHKPEARDVILAWVGDVDRAVRLAGKNALVIVDEHHSLHAYGRVMVSELEHAQTSYALHHYVSPAQAVALRVLIDATRLIDADSGAVQLEPIGERDALEAVRSYHGRLEYSQWASTPPAGHKGLAVLRTLLGMWSSGEQPRAIVDGEKVTGWEATVPTSLGLVLGDRATVCIVLSATPVVEAYPVADWHHARIDVQDAPNVEIKRTHHYLGRVGRKALSPASRGVRVVDRDAVETQVRRLIEEDFAPGELSLLCTYKIVADALRPDGSTRWLIEEYEARGYRIVVAHFGAVRGKNHISGHSVLDFDALSALGDHWSGGIDELAADVGAVDYLEPEVWRALCAAELAQFFGRARAVRRTRPVRMAHRGEVAPLDWHAGQGVELASADARVVSETERARVQSELRETLAELIDDWGVERRNIAEACGLVDSSFVRHWGTGAKPIPAEHGASLRALRPGLVTRRDAIGSLVRQGRLAALADPRRDGMRKRDWETAVKDAEARRARRAALLAGLTDDTLDELEWRSTERAEALDEERFGLAREAA